MLEDLPSEFDRGPLDPVRIFEALQRHEVEYLTIGGVAVNAHGHVRNTRDVDSGNFTLRTAAGGLDLFDPNEIPGGLPYEEMRLRAVEAIVEGVTIRAVGFDDLIRLKRESGRDRDLEDVATLLAVDRREKRE
jgi:hypothetical protein